MDKGFVKVIRVVQVILHPINAAKFISTNLHIDCRNIVINVNSNLDSASINKHYIMKALC